MAWWNLGLKGGSVDKAGKVTTPPLQAQKPKYGDKKMVKAVRPRKRRGK